MVVALQDGVVVGQARGVIHLHPDEEDELYVDNLGVTPALHRRGVGRRLMDALIAWGKERGCTHGWVATESDNAPAIGLYRALGAEPVAMVYFEYDDWD
jgi:ribosomal protein S18 acetylase RimI-like enzyme